MKAQALINAQNAVMLQEEKVGYTYNFTYMKDIETTEVQHKTSVVVGVSLLGTCTVLMYTVHTKSLANTRNRRNVLIMPWE